MFNNFSDWTFVKRADGIRIVEIQLSKNFNKIMSELAEISNRKNQMALEFLKNTYIWFR